MHVESGTPRSEVAKRHIFMLLFPPGAPVPSVRTFVSGWWACQSIVTPCPCRQCVKESCRSWLCTFVCAARCILIVTHSPDVYTCCCTWGVARIIIIISIFIWSAFVGQCCVIRCWTRHNSHRIYKPCYIYYTQIRTLFPTATKATRVIRLVSGRQDNEKYTGEYCNFKPFIEV